MLHVDTNKLHVNIIMLHVDIIYLACRGKKYATIYKLLSRCLQNLLSCDLQIDSTDMGCNAEMPT